MEEFKIIINPVSNNQTPYAGIQEEFKDKAFCIVGDEMKAKIKALGLSEDDLINSYPYKNAIGEYLEFIDIYFNELMTIKKFLWEKNKKIVKRLGDNPPQEAIDEYLEIAQQDTKKDLIDQIVTFEELSTLFSHLPNEGINVIISCIEKGLILNLITALRSGIEKYTFSWDLLIEFFEKVPREVYTSRSDQEDPDKSFELFLKVYNNLSMHVDEPTLFNDLLKLSIASGKEKVGSLLKTLRSFYNGVDIEILKIHYQKIIKLGIIAGKNNPIIFSNPAGKLLFLYDENKDLIMSCLEKLGPDFIYILKNNSGFLYDVSQIYPDRCVEFCENLKKLADYSQSNDTFYNRCLTRITEFVVEYPDKWDYLLKIGEIFGKNIPGILSIGNNFINELIKYFPNNYEEILLEVRDVGEHIHEGNEGNLLTWGLKFLAKFLEEGKEMFLKNLYELRRINDQKLKKNHNTGNILFIDGLQFITYYMFWFPESWPKIGEKIIKIINKHWENKNENDENFLRQFMGGFNNYIDTQIIEQDPVILDELLNFLEKVGGSKDALRVISSLKDLVDYKQKVTSPNKYFTHRNNLLGWQEEHDRIVKSLKEGNKNSISYSLAYLLKHKKSKIIPFIKNLNLIKDLNIGININSVLLGGVSLEYLSNLTLEENLSGEKAEDTEIWKYFLKIGGQNHPKIEEMKVWINSIMPKKGKSFDKSKVLPTLIKIQNVFAEILLDYFEKVIHKKIHLKFRREFGLKKDFDDGLLNENLIEVYKMYSSTRINKKHTFELIQRYLNGEVYTGTGDVLQTYPYNRKENKDFLQENLEYKAQIWLSRNEKVYDINEENNCEEKTDNIPERIAHHLKIANEKLKLLEIKDKKGNQIIFETHGDLRKFFNLTLKKEREKYDTNLFNDLELQINEIERLLKSNNEQRKKVSKIKIYHELDPLKIAMMGNWVDGSCLSYYHSVGNYWSAITNALEVNKGVFYIEDEYGNVIARVLVGIDNNGDLEIHPMYLKGNIGINLKEIFYFQYMGELTSKLGTTKQGDRDKVKLLFCDNWYSGD